MTKLAIYINGKPNIHGHKRREFTWSPTHGCYLYEGRELDATEFNAVFERCEKRNSDMQPLVKVLSVGNEIPPPPAPTSPAPKAASTEITADEAEAILQRLRPERLKLKPGRKAGAPSVTLD